MRKEGHGEHIKIQENVADPGKKDKQVTAAETLSFYPPAPRGKLHTGTAKNTSSLSLPASSQRLSIQGSQASALLNPATRHPATQAPFFHPNNGSPLGILPLGMKS